MWAEEQAQRCPRCGTFAWEWEENEGAWHADTYRCYGCEARDDLERHLRDDLESKPPSDADGLQIRFFRKPREDLNGS